MLSNDQGFFVPWVCVLHIERGDLRHLAAGSSIVSAFCPEPNSSKSLDAVQPELHAAVDSERLLPGGPDQKGETRDFYAPAAALETASHNLAGAWPHSQPIRGEDALGASSRVADPQQPNILQCSHGERLRKLASDGSRIRRSAELPGHCI